MEGVEGAGGRWLCVAISYWGGNGAVDCTIINCENGVLRLSLDEQIRVITFFCNSCAITFPHKPSLGVTGGGGWWQMIGALEGMQWWSI